MSDLQSLIGAANRHRWFLELVRGPDGEWSCTVEWGHRIGWAEDVSATGRTVQVVVTNVWRQLEAKGKM